MSNNETTIFKALSLKDKYYIGENKTAQDKIMSFELIGLIAYLSSLPDNWKINAKDIERTGCGKDKAYRLLNELKEHGFLNRIVHRYPDGRVEKYDYQFYAIKEDNPEYEPLPEYQETVNQETVKQNIQSKEVKKEIKNSIAPKSRDIKAEILLAFNSNKSVKLNTLELSLALGFDIDVFDILPLDDSENYNHILQELWTDNILIWQDTQFDTEDNGKRLYWLAALGETKATCNEVKTIADLIAEIWEVNGGTELLIAHQLNGTAKDKRYKPFTESFKGKGNQITLDEIRQYPTWWKDRCNGQDLALPTSPSTLSRWILTMRQENASKPTQDDISAALNYGYEPD